jgi:hypothetical protein
MLARMLISTTFSKCVRRSAGDWVMPLGRGRAFAYLHRSTRVLLFIYTHRG